MNNKLTSLLCLSATIFLNGYMLGCALSIPANSTFIRKFHQARLLSCPKSTQLCAAVIFNNAKAVKTLLKSSNAPELCGTFGASLLEQAYYYGNKKIIDALKLHGAQSQTPALMHHAAMDNHFPFAKYLFDEGWSVNTCRECLITPLHDAAYLGNYETAQFLLDNGARADAVDQWGKTPLHDAVYQHNWRVAELLLNRVDLNRTDQSGLALWQLIIKETANPSCKDLRDDANKIAITNLLKAALDHKTDPSSKISPLHAACYYLNPQAVTMSLQAGADVNMQNFLGKTPLHDALDCDAFNQAAPVNKEIFLNQYSIVLQLLRAGTNPNKSDNNGITPFAMAIRHNLIELASKLLDHKADPNQKLDGYASVLHYCAAINRADIARHVLNHGANKGVVNPKGHTPLQSAYFHQSNDVIELLSTR